MPSRRAFLGALRRAAPLIAAVACRRAGSAGTTLRLAVRADVTGFFPGPSLQNEAYSLQINSNIFEGLVRFDGRLRLVPALALRWENPDAQTYVFDLKQGLRFSDGRPLGAEDVAASLDAARHAAWPTREYLRAVESVRVLGPDKLAVRTRTPDLILLHRLYAGFVIPQAAATNPRDATPAVGTGPYRLEHWEPARSFVLGPNSYHRGPRPDFERAEFSVVPEAEERVGRVLAGEADVADHVPLHRIAELRTRPGVRLVVQPSLRVLFLGMRVADGPLADVGVREAIGLAIDRDELVARALDGHAQPASQVVPPAVVGFNPHLPPTRPDRERARALLARAGMSEAVLELEGPNNRYVHDTRILQELARQLGLVGLRVRPNPREKNEFFRVLRAGSAPLFLLGWSCETGDAGNVLDPLFHSQGQVFGGSPNPIGLADPEMDRLIDASNAATALPDRTTRLQEAIARLAALHVVVPLVVQTETVLLSRRIMWEPPANLAFQLAEFGRVE